MRAPATLSLIGTVALVAAALACSIIWLTLTDPVSVADAFNGRTVSPVIVALARAVTHALEGLLAYL